MGESMAEKVWAGRGEEKQLILVSLQILLYKWAFNMLSSHRFQQARPAVTSWTRVTRLQSPIGSQKTTLGLSCRSEALPPNTPSASLWHMANCPKTTSSIWEGEKVRQSEKQVFPHEGLWYTKTRLTTTIKISQNTPREFFWVLLLLLLF